MKWTAYVGPQATNVGRFDEKRDALRAAWLSSDEGDFFFLIGRSYEEGSLARRLTIYRRSDKAPLFTTDSWTLGTEVDMAKELVHD